MGSAGGASTASKAIGLQSMFPNRWPQSPPTALVHICTQQRQQCVAAGPTVPALHTTEYRFRDPRKITEAWAKVGPVKGDGGQQGDGAAALAGGAGDLPLAPDAARDEVRARIKELKARLESSREPKSVEERLVKAVGDAAVSEL